MIHFVVCVSNRSAPDRTLYLKAHNERVNTNRGASKVYVSILQSIRSL